VRPRGRPPTAALPRDSRGLLLHPGFLSDSDRAEIRAWLATIHPLWEHRYPTGRPPPRGEVQRRLLRPVYWLGNWQFACLGYYEPPRGVHDRAVQAEPYPPVLARVVRAIEARVRGAVPPAFVPAGWTLNTCLVNFYGDRRTAAGWEDVARVGEHRDFEPGPVASVSLGARARFQFVAPGAGGAPVRTMVLEEGALQVFSGPLWKDALLHRVQRVDGRGGDVPPDVPDFRTRRVNFTFRWVPEAHVVPFARLGAQAREDVREYVRALAVHAPAWARFLADGDAVDRGGGLPVVR
jgi:alkylated DNA repair protein (DNA oxidative demethylase)